MHCVLPPVGGSLAPEDPFQELVLDPWLKNANSKKYFCSIKPTTIHLWYAPPRLVVHKTANWKGKLN